MSANDKVQLAGAPHKPHPSRHGADLPAARQMASRLRLLIKGNPEPDEAAWQAMGDALWRGDKLADDLVAWMHELGMARAWGLFERALHAGAANSQDMPAPLRRFIEATQGWPDWVDADELALGARVLQSTGLHGMMVLRDAGLMAGYQASAINQTLIMTGSLHKGAQRRVAETTTWWLACTDDGGMAPGGAGFTMTLRVRVMHALVRHQLLHGGKWDENKLGLPVNQLDMQATYLAFSVVQIVALKTTGVWLSTRESQAVMHLWRYIGWLMGVEPGLLSDDEQQGRAALYQNVLSQAGADESSVMLGRALMDEPLQRHYANLPGLRGRMNKARHLSLVRWFVGTSGMRALGLPATLPWYPLLMMVPLAMRTTLIHLLPGGLSAWAKRGRDTQRRYLQVLLGARPPQHLTGGAPQHEKQAR
ncbi:MAG TPA: oxygenase MpaB family protein [Aquabacterium sp.]|uniref:oxygenase MpaB family protein n=1 Tax=Aquabacterium sp. TaxID=1872578 RepID=UPI002E301615|nr:oxygenase MpaB family protein [Aquabacterium sp.]HEX5354969.1 oxygenase MpaB family protein [Aquabacterium sp.]